MTKQLKNSNVNNLGAMRHWTGQGLESSQALTLKEPVSEAVYSVGELIGDERN